MKYLIVVFIGFFLVGCGGAQQNVRVADTNSPIASDRAIVELHRTKSFVGAARTIKIMDNGNLIGRLGNDSKLIWERSADEIMCINNEQWEQTYMKYIANPVISMLAGPAEPNCFKLEPGVVNKFKLLYVRGLIVSESDWLAIQKEDKERSND